MSEDQPLNGPAPEGMSGGEVPQPASDPNWELLYMLKSCRDQLTYQRSVIAVLEPKAKAYDRLSVLLDQMSPNSFVVGHDNVYHLDEYIEMLEATTHEAAKAQADADAAEVNRGLRTAMDRMAEAQSANASGIVPNVASAG